MLTIKQKELYFSYVYNHREFLVSEVKQLQHNLRYRKIDSVDCMELALAVERLNAFEDFCKCINVIFSIGEDLSDDNK